MMNDSTRVMRRLRRVRPPVARTAAAIIATAAIGLLAACSGSPSSAGSGGSPNAGAAASSQIGIRYASCMRSHGVPKYPDPTYDSAAGWGFSLLHVVGFDPNSTRTDNLMDECDRALPAGIGVPLSRPGRPG